MLRQLIDIDGYWLATVIYIPQRRDMPDVAEALGRLGCPATTIDHVINLMDEDWNKGFTWSSPDSCRSVTIIGRATSWCQFFDTLLHETKHIVDEIVEAYEVNNYGEPPAYLQGEIGRQMAPMIRRIAYPCHC